MGLNAYFAFQVVGPNGSGSIPYRLALTAVFVEGLIFIFLALTGMRQWLVRLIPATIKTATGVGIGLFLTEIGLSYAAGIGAITGGWKSTPLALGGCPPELIDSQTQMCGSGLMSNPKVGLSLYSFYNCICRMESETNMYTDVGGHYLWRNSHSVSHVFQGQVRSDHRNCVCVNFVLAVSLLVLFSMCGMY